MALMSGEENLSEKRTEKNAALAVPYRRLGVPEAEDTPGNILETCSRSGNEPNEFHRI